MKSPKSRHIVHTLCALAATWLTSANAGITIVNQASGFLGSTKSQVTTTHNGSTQVSFDATGVDKLVVAIGTESGNNGQQVTQIGVSFNGVAMERAVFGNTRAAAGDCGGAAIFHLDSPPQTAATFSVSITTTSGNPNGGHVSIFGLAGTAPGVGNTSAASATQASAGPVSGSLTTSAVDSWVFATAQNSGTNNNSGTPAVVAPLALGYSGQWGSSGGWSGVASARQLVPAPGTTITPTFTTNAGSNIQVVAAEFFPPSTDIPTNPSPAYGILVPGGDVELSWTNLAPETGTEVWVDVWFGSDPESLVKVVDATTDGPNRTTATVNAPLAGTWYWRVDSYVSGAPSGEPVTGTVFFFTVVDGDNDGLPDSYELAYTNPPSPTAMVPGEDDDSDGLTNLEEYNLGTLPNNPDTDGDTLLDGPELTGVGLRPATDPLNFDTDGDGLSDGVESNSGAWVGASDTGTDPTKPDTDGDGLPDGVETNTGEFISASNTGTSPLNTDSDNDDVGDWYEVVVSNTDPTDANDKPAIPYPLPPVDPGDVGTGSKPVKVFILSGQSNMVAFGRVDGTAKGTLQTFSKLENKFPNLVNQGTGEWAARNDVRYRGVLSAVGDGPLAPGFGANANSFGPELGFGHVLGWYLDEPVLLIKAAVGGRALGWDFLPPGSVPFTVGPTTYAGYGDAPANWPSDGAPTSGPAAFYGGYQFDQSFKRFGDWHPTASAGSVTNTTSVLDNFGAEYPEWAGRGFEIAGFVWWQGWNDGLSYTTHYADRYEQNMVRFIKEIRAYYEAKYENNISPNAPFVLATAGFQGFTNPVANRATVVNAQLAVDGTAGHYPEFTDNVRTIDSRPFWRAAAESPQNDESHYNHNAETYMIVGDLLGRAMVELLDGGTNPGSSYTQWAEGFPELDDTDPSLDFDLGGLETGLEWVLGGDPTLGGDDAGLAPAFDNSDPENFVFTYKRSDDAQADANTTIAVEYGSDLIGWTTATDGVDGVGIDDTAVPQAGFRTVVVTIPKALASGDKLFARLKVTFAP